MDEEYYGRLVEGLEEEVAISETRIFELERERDEARKRNDELFESLKRYMDRRQKDLEWLRSNEAKRVALVALKLDLDLML